MALLPGLLPSQTIQTVAGTGQPTLNHFTGNIEDVNLGDPFGVEFDSEGRLYICEVRNHRILRANLKTGNIKTIVGTGIKGFSTNSKDPEETRLNEPYEVRIAPTGDIFFVEMQNHIVRKIDRLTGLISIVAGTGTPGFDGDGHLANKAQLNRPHSIALFQESLFIADIGNHRIRRVNLSTGIIETYAGTGHKKLPVENSQVRNSPVFGPRALFVSPSQGKTFLWVALREGNSIWRINLDDPKWESVAGTGRKGYSGDGDQAKQATFNGPKGIAISGDFCFVVDTENQAIREINLRTGKISTVAGNGKRGGGGDGGKAVHAQLDRPHGIGIFQGHIFVGDTLNHRIRRIAIRPVP